MVDKRDNTRSSRARGMHSVPKEAALPHAQPPHAPPPADDAGLAGAPAAKAASGTASTRAPRRRSDVIHRSALGADGDANDAQAPVGEFTEALRVERARVDEALSVYVHLPFCPSRCLSCDHQTSVSHDAGHVDRYLDAMEHEIALVTEHLGTGRHLQQLHLGGGTPNYLSEVQLVRLVDMLDRHFLIDDLTESSLEANAHRASMAQLTLLHGLGFRGINLELRDLDAGVQEALGRRQSLDVVRDVVESARQVGFERVSTDIVYGLPRQSVESIRDTVQKLVALEPDRISCYSFSRRPELFQHQHAVDAQQLPSIADKLAIFSRIVDGLCGADYEWVGLDCFARRDDVITRAQAEGLLHRNWIGYTAQSGRSLVGFGSSAVSDLPTVSVRNQPTIDRWRASLEQGQLPIGSGETLSPELRRQRDALSDLMCNLKLDGTPFGAGKDGLRDPTLQRLYEDGFVEIDANNSITVTESGRFALHQLWGDASPSYRWAHAV